MLHHHDSHYLASVEQERLARAPQRRPADVERPVVAARRGFLTRLGLRPAAT